MNQEIWGIEKSHIVFLHHKFENRSEDDFLINLAKALQEAEYKVSIYYTEDLNDSEDLNLSKLYIRTVKCIPNWVPKSWNIFKSIILAFYLIFFPPKPYPKLIVLDIHPVTLSIFSTFTNIKTVFLAHFSTLKKAEPFSKYMTVTDGFFTVRSLQHSKNIIVQSKCLADIMQRSFPNIKNKVRVIYPAIEMTINSEKKLNIATLIPNLPKPRYCMFVCFGSYKTKSNILIILKAFENLLLITEDKLKETLRLVIADDCEKNDKLQDKYYIEVLESVKDKSFSSQVSFIRNPPKIYKKTLIENSVAALFPNKNEVFPNDILTTLFLGIPIIATNSGFAKEALQHRVSGILIKPYVYLFTAAMNKLITNAATIQFLRDMAKYQFNKNYSYEVLKNSINKIVEECTQEGVYLNKF